MNKYMISNTSTDLGTLLSEYPVSRIRQIVFLLASFAMIALGVFIAVAPLLPSSDPRIVRPAPYFVVGIGAILILVGLGMIVYGYLMLFRSTRVSFYEQGMESVGAFGRHDRWLWTDVVTLTGRTRQAYYGPPIYNYAIKFRDGKRVVITSAFRDFNKTGRDIVERKTGEALWPSVWSTFSQGQVVRFGKIEVDRNGIREGRKSVGWQEIAHFGIEGPNLFIERKAGRDVRFRGFNLPNAHVLVNLMGAVLTQNR
jgi:uncharacterized protein DUF6585